MARIAGIGSALPAHYYGQDELMAEFTRLWGHRFHNPARLEQIHRNVLVDGRHLALPLEAYERLDGFGAANDAFIGCALDLGQRAVERALAAANLEPQDVDAIYFVSVTGVAAPSVDARLMNRLPFRSDLKRVPIFGLGCVAGAAGIARAADYLAGHPGEVALLLSVELCSLTLQREDVSIQNIIGSGLFGDGAAAVALVGSEHRAPGPTVVANRSVFYPQTEDVMGWNVSEGGFQIVLSGDVPSVARDRIRGDVDAFLASQGLELDEISLMICHPGGPKVLEAFEQALERPREDFAVTWTSLREVGNLSSASVLMVLEQTLRKRDVPPGTLGLMISMGPGFCSELVLLRW